MYRAPNLPRWVSDAAKFLLCLRARRRGVWLRKLTTWDATSHFTLMYIIVAVCGAIRYAHDKWSWNRGVTHYSYRAMLIYQTASAGVRLGQKAPFAFWANHMRDDAARGVCKGTSWPFARGVATICTTIAQSTFLIVPCFAMWYIYLVLFVVMPDNVTLCKVGHDRTKGVIVMSATTFSLDVGLTALSEYIRTFDNRLSSFPDAFGIGDYLVCSREYPCLPFPPENSRYHFDFGVIFSDYASALHFLFTYVAGNFDNIEDYNVEIWHVVSDVDSVLYNPAIFGPDSPVFTVVFNFNTRSSLDESIKVYKYASFDDAYTFAYLCHLSGYRHFVIDRHDYRNGRLVGVKTLGFCGSDKLVVLDGE